MKSQAASRPARPSRRGTTSPRGRRGLGTRGGTGSSWEVGLRFFNLFDGTKHKKKKNRKFFSFFGTNKSLFPHFLLFSLSRSLTLYLCLCFRRLKNNGKKQQHNTTKTEGAGVLVLESLEHARRRGAPIICEFAGGALGCDAHHMTEPRPDGSGVRACIEQAVRAG